MPRKSTSACSSDVWAEVCSAEQSLRIDFNALCGQPSGIDASPIDDFYEYVSSLIPVGTLAQLTTNPALGHTLLLVLVSGTELYFLRVLATLINLCSLCRQAAARQSLSLGAVDYYGRDLGLGLLENISIAGSGEVKKQTLRIIGIDIPSNSSLDEAIREFERLCELRHAATHARGHLGHQNLRDLGIDSHRKRLALTVGVEGLHVAASVCQNVVRAYNRFIYRKVIERWIGERLLSGRWPRDRARFSKVYFLFRSTRDDHGPPTAYRAYVALRPVIRRALLKEAQRGAVQQQ